MGSLFDGIGIFPLAAIHHDITPVRASEFEYNSEVELINPLADTVANASFLGVDVEWYIKAEDIVQDTRMIQIFQYNLLLTKEDERVIATQE